MIVDVMAQSHDAVMGFVDVLAMPGQNIRPQAPGQLGAKINSMLSIVQYVCYAIAIVGVFSAGATLVISRREGTSEEATTLALRVIAGVVLISGGVGIVISLAS